MGRRGNGGMSDDSARSGNQLTNRPNVIGDAQRHRGRTAQRFADAAQIVKRDPERDRAAYSSVYLRTPWSPA